MQNTKNTWSPIRSQKTTLDRLCGTRPLREFARTLLVVGICWTAATAVGAEQDVDGPWRYTTRKPADGWQLPGFDDSAWQNGRGGFGVSSTPGSRVGTNWTTDNIWLRRQIELEQVPKRSALLVHHDEDAEVFINGERVARFEGYTTEYKVVPLDEAGRKTLVDGMNILAVHCVQTSGGQFIDVHVIDADNVPPLPAAKRPTMPFKSELITNWGGQVTAENAWQEYPRPQLVREGWRNLNGHWDYAVASRDAAKPAMWDGKILVPFCIESKLSGVQRLLDPTESLWYHRTIEWERNPDRRTMLNFEAVDYRCRVWVNDVEVGQHVGGNNPFSLDITDAIRDGANEIVVRVEDSTGGSQLRGKQRLDPQGIWYTRVSGIWQTVWLEEVPRRYVDRLKITNEIAIDESSDRDDARRASSSITVRPILSGEPVPGEQVRVVVLDGERAVGEGQGDPSQLSVSIPNAKLWSPTEPHLYNVNVSILDGAGKVIDQVRSYTGLRIVGQIRDDAGHLRFTLNGDVIFHWGTLDQGWWPDGLLTPPCDDAMRYDVEYLKNAGFNMIRKHIKTEPRRYYYHCDRLGVMLWQDQPSGGTNPKWTRLAPNPEDAVWSDDEHAQFMREFEAMVDTLENHPSIVVWVPFNEAWGQHRTIEVGKWIVQRDPTRLTNIASGGNFWPVGHIVDGHKYPHPGFPFDPPRFKDFIKVMGEFGGHGWPAQGHLWDNSRRNWGYGGLPQTIEEYKDRYRESIRLLAELKTKGIAAGVYTQTTDVEGEINGLMSYDRKVLKIPPAELKEIHQALFE